MKFISLSFYVTELILLLLLTLYLGWMSSFVIGYSDARFFPTQILRFLLLIAPYFSLIPATVFTYYARKKVQYLRSILVPIALIGLTFFASQYFLRSIPDPIQENFGAREEPYPGFLYLPEDQIPQGFKKKEHRYTKTYYSVSYQKLLDGKNIGLTIAQGDTVIFGTNGCEEINSFIYRNIEGHVYSCTHSKTGKVSLNLIWLNPPKQRISIYLDQLEQKPYTPIFLIEILRHMKEVTQ